MVSSDFWNLVRESSQALFWLLFLCGEDLDQTEREGGMRVKDESQRGKAGEVRERGRPGAGRLTGVLTVDVAVGNSLAEFLSLIDKALAGVFGGVGEILHAK